jgi:ElaB/YqjD/DUF883 family membrane-anchored ribosome-binding protein
VQPTHSNGPDAASSSESNVNASEMSQTAENLIDAKRGSAAGGLDSAAEKVANATHMAADAVGTTADYVRGNNLKNMLADVQRIVRDNPGPALLTAAALGFLIARTFSRD